MNVVWTRHAIRDLEAIYQFIASDSARYAADTVERIVAATRRLSQFPNSGRVVPELGHPEVREVIAGRYRIVYRLKPESTEVLTVFHGSRLYRP